MGGREESTITHHSLAVAGLKKHLYDDYVNECQDANSLHQTVAQGNILICSYSIKYVLGQSTIDNVVKTAMNLSAAGIMLSMDPFIIGLQLNPVPMSLLGIIIPSTNNSKLDEEKKERLNEVKLKSK
ncbi:hypothetical protein Tco_1223629 [Tanacetum coccineum]